MTPPLRARILADLRCIWYNAALTGSMSAQLSDGRMLTTVTFDWGRDMRFSRWATYLEDEQLYSGPLGQANS